MDGVLRPLDGGSRIDAIMPPVYGASHASNLLELPDGTLLLVWFSNGVEGGDGVGIVASRLLPGAGLSTPDALLASALNIILFIGPPLGTARLCNRS